MSTELNSIKGKTEYIKNIHSQEVGYKENLLHLSSFYGGKDRGKCLQLAIDDNTIQLTHSGVLKLMKELCLFVDPEIENYL